jgi:hypothetical protein
MVGQCLIHRSRHETLTRRKQSTLLLLLAPNLLARKVTGKSVNASIQINSGVQKGDFIPVTFVVLAGFVVLLLPRTHTVEAGFQRVNQRAEACRNTKRQLAFHPPLRAGLVLTTDKGVTPLRRCIIRTISVSPVFDGPLGLEIDCNRLEARRRRWISRNNDV